MCGIFSSSSKKEFNKQYTLNLTRGASAFSGLFFNKGKMTILKTEDTRYCPFFPADLYLGHLRAPTGNTREFSSIHSHPFEYGDWIVAHNGILTNYDELKELVLDGNKRFEVDSSLIPYYLHYYGMAAFDRFKGTWACWMYNKALKTLYVTRSDNTLFFNPLNGDFSSAQIEGYIALQERRIFKIHQDTGSYEQVFLYNTKPTYFVP